MTTKSLEQLQAERAEIDRQIEASELAPLTAIVDALNKPTIVAALAVLKDNVAKLTDQRHVQATNLITVLEHCPGFLTAQRDEIDARVNPPAETETEAA